MEVGLAILLFVCMTALLYVLLSLKITRQVDLQMKEFYKTRIHADIQEFYREMEGYAALMENRIQRFRSLVERSEIEQDRALRSQVMEKPAAPQSMTDRAQNKKTVVQKSESRPVHADKKKATQRSEAKATRQGSKPAKKDEPKGQASDAAKISLSAQPQVRAQQQPPSPVADFARQSFADESDAGINADTTIAEELMKDLFAHDEIQLSRSVKNEASIRQRDSAVSRQAVANSKQTEQADEGNASATSIFARIGKALEPVVFGEKHKFKSVAAHQAQQVSQVGATDTTTQAKQNDFAEILRRAEEIKAQKKAERERAEVEARAEFYTTGDTFVRSARSTQLTDAEVPAQPLDLRVRAEKLTAGNAETSALPRRDAVPRNNLAVKSLDEHTINFLIDSLKHDAGYRKQALRALTENNIPLEEIARLSRIDIGELQLMRQLGRF